MDANYDFIESLRIAQGSRRLRVRVVRVWRQQNYLKTLGNSLEMIIVDQKVFVFNYCGFFWYKLITPDACLLCLMIGRTHPSNYKRGSCS